MDLRFKDQLATMPDLGHRLRRLRGFSATFHATARAVAHTYGIAFDIDEARLTRAFLDWAEALEARKDHARVNRPDFIVFAAGLVLRELIRHQPVRARGGDTGPRMPAPAAEGMDIVRFWPEGFLYTNYCVAVIAAIHEQEFGRAPTIDDCAGDLRTWWSYRENTAEMPDYAVAYLDRFLGGEPNWVAPDDPSARAAMRDALRGGAPDALTAEP
jgi:hypothetical protein